MEVTKVECLDWYDGPITAVTRVMGEDAPFLAVLLAYDPDQRSRIYGLLRMTLEKERSLRQLEEQAAPTHSKRSWGEIQTTIHQVLAEHREDMCLVRCRTLREGPIHEWAWVAMDPHRGKVGCEVEDAVEPDRIRFWNDLFERARNPE